MYKKVNDWAKFVVVNSGATRWEYEKRPYRSVGGWAVEGGKYSLVSSNNDTSNWQNSLIEIDAQEYKHEFVNPWAYYFAVDRDGEGYEF